LTTVVGTKSFCHNQCDQIGRNFVVWVHFSAFGRIFF
jgi:hypothetical protein